MKKNRYKCNCFFCGLYPEKFKNKKEHNKFIEKLKQKIIKTIMEDF